jgi:hypothetical protein
MKKFFLYVLGVVPGLVQAHLNAPIIGSIYFVLFLFFLNATFMSGYWFVDQRLRMIGSIVSGILCTLIWLYAYRDLHLRLQNTTSTGGSTDQPTTSPEHSDDR